MTDTFTTEELKITTYEVDMILLEEQLKENKLRSKNWFIIFLKKIFGGNL